MGRIYTPFEIKNLFELQFFSSLDYFFARSMEKAFDEKEAIVLCSCALVSKVLFQGHICLDIKEASNTTASVQGNSDVRLQFPDLETWMDALEKSPMVSSSIDSPLVLDSNCRLYFAKYFDFQNRLISNIARRCFLKIFKMDEAIVEEMLAQSFTESHQHIVNQKNAVKNALSNHFTIISGGPGTGKTFIVSIIKKILISYALQHDLVLPKIMCAAPTGKAASKMEHGQTIHSLLKPLKNKPGFLYNKNNLLQLDVLIIDEASMIDISLLTRLFEAVPLKTRVIMLGDIHQLSSIQAGSVLKDICSVKNLSSNISYLEYNFRSRGRTGIENFSKAVNNNDYPGIEYILTSGKYSDLLFVPLQGSVFSSGFIKSLVFNGFQSFLNSETIETALDELDCFKILCAHNEGEYGTLQINHLCENILRSDHNFDIHNKPFKKIIMIKTNDYKKGLFNGDTGICFTEKGYSKAVFKDFDGNIKKYQLLDLPDNDAAFAITIHKSQGSEFETVLMILPDMLSPVLTRQLLYTGVTRAKKKVVIMGDLKIIKKAMDISVKRNSGLAEFLDRMLEKTD